MKRLTGKGPAVLLAVLGGALVIVTASRDWVTGRVDDAVLGSTTLAAVGTDVAPGLVALALVTMAGAVAAVAAGPLARRLAAVFLVLALAGITALTLRVVLDPAGLLGPIAAKSAGRTGALPTTGAGVTAWPWLALLGVALGLAGAVTIALGQRRWAGLSARYDRAEGAEVGRAGTAGARGERVPDDWERLSAGEDPTEDRGDRPGERTDADPDAAT